MTIKGKFIVIEGIGGSGKSTQLKFTEKYLKKKKIKAIFTREPGGCVAAEKIRKLIFSFGEKKLVGLEGEMVLFFAARKLWMDQIVRPKLNKGICVITDRSYMSTGAYQGYGEGGDINKILEMADIVVGKYKPDGIILLDIGSKEFEKRRKKDSSGDPFDKKDIEYQKKVAKGYRKMARRNWGGVKWHVVDGRKSIFEVSKRMKEILDDILNLN